MKKLRTILVNICRLILGLTFIFSGYVKAIDPIGTQYKIQDYLEAVGMTGMVPDWLTLSVSVLLSMTEFSLGIFMFLGIRRRLTSTLMLPFMGIMTLITLWLALFNPVKDCGCFGDAIKLTNTQTLIKNIVLLILCLCTWKWPQSMIRSITKTNQWIAINFTILFILMTSIWSLYDLPQFDFRPYHIGANIRKGMEIPKGAQQPEFENTFIMEKDGVRKEFTLDNYPDSTWTFIDSKTVQTKEGYVPPIHDFSIEERTTGEDITQQVLADKGYTFLLIAPHLEQANDTNFGDIDMIYEYAQEHGYHFYCLTASNEKAVNRWTDMTGAEYPFCTTDETTLKTIIRSNPGLLLIKDATIIQKWSHNNLPSVDEFNEQPLEKTSIGKMPAGHVIFKIMRMLLWFILPLFLLILADRFWAWSTVVRRQMSKGKKKLSEGEQIIRNEEEKIKENSNKIISTLKKKKK